jgi:hypothetical protein
MTTTFEFDFRKRDRALCGHPSLGYGALADA